MKKNNTLFSVLFLSLLASCTIDEQPDGDSEVNNIDDAASESSKHVPEPGDSEVNNIDDAASESSNWSNEAQAPSWNKNPQKAYKLALNVGLSQKQAIIFARAYQEKIEAKKSKAWATFYASKIALGKPESEAVIFADHKEAELQVNQALGRTHTSI